MLEIGWRLRTLTQVECLPAVRKPIENEQTLDLMLSFHIFYSEAPHGVLALFLILVHSLSSIKANLSHSSTSTWMFATASSGATFLASSNMNGTKPGSTARTGMSVMKLKLTVSEVQISTKLSWMKLLSSLSWHVAPASPIIALRIPPYQWILRTLSTLA